MACRSSNDVAQSHGDKITIQADITYAFTKKICMRISTSNYKNIFESETQARYFLNLRKHLYFQVQSPKVLL
jgi:hypothetical protein